MSAAPASRLFWIAVVIASLAAGCDERGLIRDASLGDAASSVDALQGPADDSGPREFVPYVAGDFVRVYAPNQMRYLNDHCITQAPDGTWHLYGITNTGDGMPQDERSLLHATAPALIGPWSDQPDILSVDPSLNEQVMWAPFVYRVDAQSPWTMFYWGGYANNDVPLRGIRVARSLDLIAWQKDEHQPTPPSRPPGGRDPMVLRDGSRWLLYSVGVDDQLRGQIMLSINTTDSDTSGWAEPFPIITDPVPNYPWGNLESPYVVPYAGYYYLFLTRTAPDNADYARTNVFRSSDPTHFAWDPIADIRSHAAEIVVDGDQYYITSAGWPAVIGQQNRGLSIAPLRWAEL